MHEWLLGRDFLKLKRTLVVLCVYLKGIGWKSFFFSDVKIARSVLHFYKNGFVGVKKKESGEKSFPATNTSICNQPKWTWMCADALDKIRCCGGSSGDGGRWTKKSYAEIRIARSMKFSLVPSAGSHLFCSCVRVSVSLFLFVNISSYVLLFLWLPCNSCGCSCHAKLTFIFVYVCDCNTNMTFHRQVRRGQV